MLMEVPWGLLVQSWKIPLPCPRQAGIQQGTCSKPVRKRTTPDPAISVILSLKLCSTLLEEKKNVTTTCKPSVLPLQRTHISHQHSGALGHCTVAQPQCGSYQEVKSKNKLTCTAKEAFTEQSVRENAFPFIELARGETPNGGASTGTLERGGSNPRKEEKRGKTHTLACVLVKSQTMGTNSQRQHRPASDQKHVNTGRHS